MSVGIAGAHRTGKTSLAIEVAQRGGIPFVQTSVSTVFERMGIHPSAQMTFDKRLQVQKEVLDACCEVWANERSFFITDRTPLDMIAYTLADVTANVGSCHSAELSDYIERCFEAANRYFSAIVLLQPGIPLVFDPGKPSAALNPSYIEHLNTLLFGLLYDPRCKTPSLFIRRSVVGMNDRVEAIMYAIARSSMIAKEAHGYDKGVVVTH